MPRSEQAATAPGVVKVRLSGSATDVDMMTRLFGTLAIRTGALEILEQSAPCPNRRDPGERVYLTILLHAGRALADSNTEADGQARRGGQS